jgi:hypothetical protein
MNRFLFILLLIISTVDNLYSQKSTKFLADEIFLEIQRKSINSEGKSTLYSEYLKTLKSEKHNSETRAELTSRLFTFYQRQGLYSNFNKAFGKHKNELIKNSILSQLWKVKALEIGGKYIRMLEASKTLLESSENNGSNTDQSDAYRMMALSKMYSNQKDSALYYSNMALNFAKRSDSKEAVALTFRDLSNIYAHFDMIGKSTSTLLKLNTEAQRLKDDDLLCWTNLKIAERTFTVNSFGESRTYYRKSLNIADKNNFRVYKVQIYTGLAEVSLAEDQLNQAIGNITKGYKFINEKEESIYGLKLKLVHSKYLIEEGYFSEAMALLDEILESYNEIDSKKGKGNTYHLIGRTHFKSKKWADAKQSFMTSKTFLLNYPQSIYRIMNYKFLGQVNAKQKGFEKAYENIKTYQKLIDDHSSLSSSKAINELTQMYSRELREYRIKEQERVINDQVKEKELLALKGQKQMSTIVLISIILISTIIIILFYLRQLKINQTNKEVEMSQTLLRTQMNPHFIFNAMSVIQSSLYENNPAKSSKFLVSFSRLIRLILENSPKEFITLETEIEILEKYLKTQKLRFENRFDYQINVPETLVFKKVLIPPMITQPFVENAIEHGQLNTIENGQITINIVEKEEMLYVEVSDNGVGITESTKKKNPLREHKSMAMDITNQRVSILNKKYKSKARIAISNLTEEKHSGTRVEIFLPLLTENLNFDSE